jgi:RHS repeat-associated protein
VVRYSFPVRLLHSLHPARFGAFGTGLALRHVTPSWVLHSNFGCCIGTIQKSATYKISGAVERRAIPIRELAENKRQQLKRKTGARALRANRSTQIVQGGATVSFGYDNANRRTSLTLPNGIIVSYSYDNASQLTGLSYAKGSTTLGNLTYAYDLNGRRTSIGGSFAATNLPNAVSTTAYNVNNQLTTWGTANLFYDLNGNMTSDGTHSYTWDARNHLKQIDSGTTASFVYDPFGRRTSKTILGAQTGFLYDDANPVQELSGTTVTANSLMGGIDEVFQRTDSAGARNFLTDALGSSIASADSTGTIQTQYTFDPFGNTTSSGASTSNSFAYTGRELDATGLYFDRARYYNPMIGRFISEDPIGFGDGVNIYSYVYDNPLNFRDSLGLSASSVALCFLKGAAVGAVGAAAVGVVAVGAVAVGAPVAAVTGVLCLVAIAGGTALGIDTLVHAYTRNWDGLAFDLGSLAGGALVGGFGGRSIAEGINGEPSSPWSPGSDLGDVFNPDKGTFPDFLRTGPSPGSAAGSAALGGAGAAPLVGRQCGCSIGLW